ncbi:macro domain-containing protein [Escherichia coli]|uniref:macro domain-containing protein n=2 Tax=Klebsiella variicola TaxID=244366 RepID=UPI001A92A5E8|nr:macro domain-containing protein [Klebsiella variicola]EHM9039515.1 hypothetical protein [Salmonella enterica]EIM7753030.1 hypothetical protein [Salmonella enterica subsp. enterica serovar Enteritidis]ELK6491016.1 hypothetical protein [Enterobacter bugandensis]ELZ1652730.1 hypothetical protein [Cronobacter sakazakii]HEM6739093.1 hypothetical protein [Citrobacter amalonaticus]
MIKSLMDLLRGIIRKPFKTVTYFFTSFSVLFTIVRMIVYFVPGIKFDGVIPLIIMLCISLGFTLKKVWKPSKVVIPIPNTATKIEIVFGDIFNQDGIRVIPANEYFDSKLGLPVSENSLHGIFINKCFGGHPESFDKQVEEGLSGKESKVVNNKIDGNSRKYEIGTSVLMEADSKKYLVFAFAHTNESTCKAFIDVKDTWIALHEMWSSLRIFSGGSAVNLPLIGSGISGLGLPTRDILNLIILSAITETKNKEVTKLIRVILHRDRFDDLDLREIKDYWEKK